MPSTKPLSKLLGNLEFLAEVTNGSKCTMPERIQPCDLSHLVSGLSIEEWCMNQQTNKGCRDGSFVGALIPVVDYFDKSAEIGLKNDNNFEISCDCCGKTAKTSDVIGTRSTWRVGQQLGEVLRTVYVKSRDGYKHTFYFGRERDLSDSDMGHYVYLTKVSFCSKITQEIINKLFTTEWVMVARDKITINCTSNDHDATRTYYANECDMELPLNKEHSFITSLFKTCSAECYCNSSALK